jgi:hypothetical protein
MRRAAEHYLDVSSQIGGMILLKDKHWNVHVLQWISKKCPRVTGFILEAETIGFSAVFDMLLLDAMYQKISTSRPYSFMN